MDNTLSAAPAPDDSSKMSLLMKVADSFRQEDIPEELFGMFLVLRSELKGFTSSIASAVICDGPRGEKDDALLFAKLTELAEGIIATKKNSGELSDGNLPGEMEIYGWVFFIASMFSNIFLPKVVNPITMYGPKACWSGVDLSSERRQLPRELSKEINKLFIFCRCKRNTPRNCGLGMRVA